MTKEDIICEIMKQGIVDDVLQMLLAISMDEKKHLKSINRENKSKLKAINKIARFTGSLDAIKSLSEYD